MEPFRVICETCHARLKVRDPAVIGQIHACPKCESMVHIVPPAGWAADNSAAETAASSATDPALSSSSITLNSASPVASHAATPPAETIGQAPSGQTAPNEVAPSQIAPGQVDSGQVDSGQVASDHGAPGQVDSGQVSTGQVAAGQVASGQVTTTHVAAGQAAAAQAIPASPRPAPSFHDVATGGADLQAFDAPNSGPPDESGMAADFNSPPEVASHAEPKPPDGHPPQLEVSTSKILKSPTAGVGVDELASLISTSPIDLFWRRVAVWMTAGGAGLFVLGSIIGAVWMRSGDGNDVPSTDRIAAAVDIVDPVKEQTSIPPAVENPEQIDAIDSANAADSVPAETDPPGQESTGTPNTLPPNDAPPVEVTAARQQLPDDPLPDESASARDSEGKANPVEDNQTAANQVKADKDENKHGRPAQSTTSDASSDAPTPQETAPRRKLDLLTLDPAQLELSVGMTGSSGEPLPPVDFSPQVARSEVDRELPDGDSDAGLAESGFDGEILPPEAETDDIAGADVTAPVRRGPTDQSQSIPQNIDEQLSLPITSIHLPDVPFARWLEMMSTMTAVPISIEPKTLQMVGMAADQPLAVNGQDVTCEELLRNTLAPHRLGFESRAGQIVIVRQEQDEQIKLTYQVDDLVSPDADTHAIAALLRRLVEPATWQQQGGTGRMDVSGRSLRIEHQRQTHIPVFLLLERLRLARGLPAKSRYPKERLAIDSTYLGLQETLNQRTTFTFLAWSPLNEVFRHWQRTSGLNVLVDWPALADHQLAPSSPVACSVIDQSWNEALDEILTPLDLAWRAVDGRTIQITSRAKADSEPSVEFYAVADVLQKSFADSAALVESLQQQIAASAGRAVADRCQFYFDEPSKRLIAAAPAAAQRVIAQQLPN